MNVLLSKRITVPEHVLFRRIENEMVILDLDAERYYGLDDVGTAMWLALTGIGSGRAAADRLLEVYDVDRDTLEADLVRLLERLSDRALLVLHEG